MSETYEGPIEPGMVFEYVNGVGLDGQRRTIRLVLADGTVDTDQGRAKTSITHLRRWARPVANAPIQSCADRAAGKAAPTVERRLAAGWVRVPEQEYTWLCDAEPHHEERVEVGSSGLCNQTLLHGRYRWYCQPCAEKRGCFADSPAIAAPTHRPPSPYLPVPGQVIPSTGVPTAPAPFKCAGAYCKTPDAPRATQSKMPIPPDWCVACFDGLAAAYMNAGGLEPDGPPPPKQPRVRDIYRPEMSEGADPDWVL